MTQDRQRKPRLPYLNTHKTQTAILFEALKRKPSTSIELEDVTGIHGGVSRRVSELMHAGCVRIQGSPNVRHRVYEVIPGTSMKMFAAWQKQRRVVRRERENAKKTTPKQDKPQAARISQKAFLKLCKAHAQALRSSSPTTRHQAMAVIEEAIIASF